MSQSHKYILLFIFTLSIVLSTVFGYFTFEHLNIWLVILSALVFGFIIGGGFVRLLIEPLEKRSNELELLSRQTLHELNLPVATILANIQMLLKKETDEKNIKRLKRVEKSADNLKQMYAELDYTIKKQNLKVEIQTCDLKDLVQERLETYTEIFSHVKFLANLESSSVKIDTMGFLKVLDNLIDNAVKYSKSDSIVKIELKDKKLSVIDEGIGMPEDFVFMAFENYYQEEKSSKGYGLGLGLVKEYCDRYKIKIYLDTKKYQGTRITLDFTGV